MDVPWSSFKLKKKFLNESRVLELRLINKPIKNLKMIRGFIGGIFTNSISIASNTAQFAYKSLTNSDEDVINTDVAQHYGSFDNNPPESSTSNNSTLNANQYNTNNKNNDLESVASNQEPSNDDNDYPLEWNEDYQDISNKNYKILFWLHLITPFSVLAYFIIMITLLLHFFTSPLNPISKTMPIPIQSLTLGSASWVFAHSFRKPTFKCLDFLVPIDSNLCVGILGTIIHSFFLDFIRWQGLLLAVPTLKQSIDFDDPSFTNMSWFIVGWSATILIVSTFQQFQNLLLYKELLTSDRVPLTTQPDSDLNTETNSTDSHDSSDLDYQLILINNMRKRRNLNAIFGQPYPNIPLPGFLFPLWRLDTLLISIGMILIIGSLPYWQTWLILSTVNASITLSWQLLSPKLGLGGLTWMSFMLAIGSFLIGLNQWRIII